MEFTLDRNTDFYRNCVRRRREQAKICQDCPFRSWIEEQEQEPEPDTFDTSLIKDMVEELATNVPKVPPPSIWVKGVWYDWDKEEGTYKERPWEEVEPVRRPCYYHADAGLGKPLKEDPCECGSWDTCTIHAGNPKSCWSSCRWGAQEYERRSHDSL